MADELFQMAAGMARAQANAERFNAEAPREIWVLTFEVNAYDQHGEYFEHAWDHKPTSEELLAAGVAMKDLSHVMNGGGRRYPEDRWQMLREFKGKRS